MTTSYGEFLSRKKRIQCDVGKAPPALSPALYDWQRAIVQWALRKGRAAIWADCGLGKTLMQVAWAEALGERTLILAPLCVAEQTVHEAKRFGLHVHYALNEREASGHRLVITNYERLEKFTPTAYGAVVLDESSILKSFDGKTRTALIRAFTAVPYRLCCTATPSPNDISELANHAEFLGLMTRPEFLATWFVHDDARWRMKGHAVTPFYRWLASWAVALRSPSDLGYHANGFQLPPLNILEHVVQSEPLSGVLFPGMAIKGIGGRLQARRASLNERVDVAVARLMVQTLGLCGEAGEVADMVKKHSWHGKELALERLANELGDVLWYVADIATAVGLTLDDIAAVNIAKLRARYPDGFVLGGGIR